MRISKFEVQSQRSIRLAKCDIVPQLMLIAGPNGAGKSTLLNELRNNNKHRDIIYLGPHRAMRRQHVQQRHLISTSISIEDLLTKREVPGFEGIQLLSGQRDPWSYDDSVNYLKHALCQVEIERTQAIAARYDRDGEIAPGTLSDPWEPLRELTSNLLPHLSFAKLDATNRDQNPCLWHTHDRVLTIDIDDLSSGEKSIIQMFYPLIEHEIKGLLAGIQGGEIEGIRPDQCILIDEPELHLHPNLQVKVMDYLRVLTSGKSIQVILTTQSPTMIEHASFEELFLLRPPELVETGENQLIQVADNEERLRLLRDIFGTTSNLTALQPVVIVESISSDLATKAMPDRKLYRALHSGFDKVTLIPGGGKSQCRALLVSLDDALKVFSSQLRAVALLDRDYTEVPNDPRVYLLPVNMIENFLLDPGSLLDAIQSVSERAGLMTINDVQQTLDRILEELESLEIERRVIQKLGIKYFRPHSPISGIPQQISAFVSKLHLEYSPESIEAALNNTSEDVKNLKSLMRRREEYHGKTVLDEFYKRHLHNTGLPNSIFKFEAARHARKRKSVNAFFDHFFSLIASNQTG